MKTIDGSYFGYLEAADGHLLLGGIKYTRSSRFQREIDAAAWTLQAYRANEAAGNVVAEHGTAWHSAPPEILWSEEHGITPIPARPARYKGEQR